MQATKANLIKQLLFQLSVRTGKHVNSGRLFYCELTESQAKLFHEVLKRSDMEDELNGWLLEGCVLLYHKHGQVQILSSYCY